MGSSALHNAWVCTRQVCILTFMRLPGCGSATHKKHLQINQTHCFTVFSPQQGASFRSPALSNTDSYGSMQ